jgi:hypothetical protein
MGLDPIPSLSMSFTEGQEKSKNGSSGLTDSSIPAVRRQHPENPPIRCFLYDRRLLHDLSRCACESLKMFNCYGKTFVQQALICYLFATKPNWTLLAKNGRNLNLIMVHAPGGGSA